MVKVFRLLTIFICLTLTCLVACSTSPQSSPLSPTEVEQTVQAAVQQGLTQAAPTPDIDATVSFRLTAIAGHTESSSPPVSPTDVPSAPPTATSPNTTPGAQDGIGKFIGDFINTLLTFIASGVSLWNTVGQFGTLAQVCCCGIPLLVGGGVAIGTLRGE